MEYLYYTVYYKKPGALFWRKHRNVWQDLIYQAVAETKKYQFDSKGKSILKEVNQIMQPFDVRVLILKDGTRIELPNSLIFKFSKERWLVEKERMEKAAKQKLQTEGGP